MKQRYGEGVTTVCQQGRDYFDSKKHFISMVMKKREEKIEYITISIYIYNP